MSAEQWENVYSGFDRAMCRDTTGRLAKEAARYLPSPVVNYKCRTTGHRWAVLPNLRSADTELCGCVRCAKAGLLVFRTTGVNPLPAEDTE